MLFSEWIIVSMLHHRLINTQCIMIQILMNHRKVKLGLERSVGRDCDIYKLDENTKKSFFLCPYKVRDDFASNGTRTL